MPSTIHGERAAYDHDYFVESRDIAHLSGKSYFDIVSIRMHQTASLLCAVGLGGMVYLFDELETVATLLHGTQQRFLAYEFLNLLLDGRKHAHCYFAFAVTPDFGARVLGDRPKGVNYEGVYSGACRFIQKWHESSVDRIILEKLGRADLVAMCRCLRRLHEETFDKLEHTQFSDDFVGNFVYDALRRNMGVRDVVKSFVHLLEISEQYREVNVPGLLRSTRENAGSELLSQGVRGAVSTSKVETNAGYFLEDIIEFCRKRNLSVIDNRHKNGALWVTHFSWDGIVADRLKKEGFRFKQGKGWWIN